MIKTNVLLSHHFIKIHACCIGYGLWILLSQNQILNHTINIPVFLYNVPENNIIIAPNTVHATIRSQRKNIYHFDTQNSAIYIDSSTLHQGNNYILLQKENIFLPDEINLINLVPASIQIQLQKAE